MNTIKLKDTKNRDESNHGLLEKIINRIDEEQISRIKRHFLTVFFGLLCAVGLLVLLFGIMQRDLVDSGSMEIFSLIFSDFRIMFADWRSFGIAVLESLPAVSIAFFLAVLFVIMKLMTILASYASRISKRKSYISYQ